MGLGISVKKEKRRSRSSLNAEDFDFADRKREGAELFEHSFQGDPQYDDRALNLFCASGRSNKRYDLRARLAGLEPATAGLEGRCSIQLSYRRSDAKT